MRRETENLYLMVSSPNGHNSQNRANPVPEAKSFHGITHEGAGAQGVDHPLLLSQAVGRELGRSELDRTRTVSGTTGRELSVALTLPLFSLDSLFIYLKARARGGYFLFAGILFK